MTRYYALVLVPGDITKDKACDSAFDLLSPYMLTEAGSSEDFKFDYLLDPEDIAALNECESIDVWRAGDIIDRLEELQVEAIITPDGQWHEIEEGQLWDDDAWLARARWLLQRQPKSLALRHVLHI